SALYVFDEMPERQEARSQKLEARTPDRPVNPPLSRSQERECQELHSNTYLLAPNSCRMFRCPRPIRIERVGLLPTGCSAPADSVTMLRAAGEACLAKSARRREEIDLVLHTGTYRSEFLCEPALAAIAAGELRINHDEDNLAG